MKRDLWSTRVKDTLGKTPPIKGVVVVMAIVGMILILWSPTKTPPPSSTSEVEKILPSGPLDGVVLEKQLSQVLSRISGVGSVETKVTLDSNGCQIYASNERRETRQTQEKDRSGTTRNITEESADRQVVLANNTPVLQETRFPEVIGVLVIAEGADDPAIEESLSEAVTGLLGLPASRVTVLPMERGEGYR